MSLDDQLSAFLGETPKQSRADVFTTEVMKRVERQVFLDQLKAAAVWATFACPDGESSPKKRTKLGWVMPMPSME